jgi:hypothetical protein
MSAKLLSYINVSPILIPFIIGIYKYKDIRKLKYLFFFVCYGVANEIASIILIKSGAQNTMPKTHLYILISFTLLCLFYQSVFKGYIKKIWFRALIVFYLVFCFVSLLFFQSIYTYPSVPFAALAIVMFTFSVMYFYKIMVESKTKILEKSR